MQAAQAEVDAANAAPELWKAQLTDGGIAGQHAAFYRLLDKVNEWYPMRVPLEQVWGIGRPLWDPMSRVHGRQPLRCLRLACVMGFCGGETSVSVQRLGPLELQL